MQCLSCKNKNTTERCEKISAKSLLFCGVHMRSKNIRHWISENPATKRALTLFQAVWRGYAIRYRIRLAGKGCLKRSLCHNDEDVATGEGKKDVSPLDYFSVEENGKVWWFEQKSMIEWSGNALEIRNPFTRTVLSSEDCCRLRNLAFLRRKTATKSEDIRWMRIVQILNECGFTDLVHHENFIAMNYTQIKFMLSTLIEDMRWWMYEKTGDKDPYALMSKRAKYHTWIKSIRMMLHTYTSLGHMSRDVSGVLLACLNDIRDPTEIAFFILTAYVRSSARL
jgi:hypothetical protein